MEATPLKVSSITDSACRLSSDPKQFYTLLTFNVSPNFATQIEKLAREEHILDGVNYFVGHFLYTSLPESL